MRIYISGPITKEPNFMNNFRLAQEMLKKEYPKAEIVNPAEINSHMPSDFSHKDYMDICFLLLSKCDYIYMLPNWRESAGACMEYGYAYAKDMVILNE